MAQRSRTLGTAEARKQLSAVVQRMRGVEIDLGQLEREAVKVGADNREDVWIIPAEAGRAMVARLRELEEAVENAAIMHVVGERLAGREDVDQPTGREHALAFFRREGFGPLLDT